MKNSRKMRGLLVMLIAFAFCFLAEPVKADDRTALDGIYVEDISVGGMTEEQITQAVNDKIEQLKPSVINLSAGEQNAQVTAGDLGLSCANPEVAREAVTIGQEGNVLKRFLTQNRLKNGETVTFSLKYTVDGEAARQAVENNTAVLNREATDATLTRENGEFIVNPGQTGCSVNVDESMAKVVNYLTTSWRGGIGGVELVTEETPAGGNPEQLALVKDLLGEGTTEYGNGTSGRKQNVAVGAEKINGTLVQPGEEFSVEAVVVPFDAENGYALAASYEMGKVVDSYGGGICQVSTTLYVAVLKAELEVTERYSHSMIVHYVDPSMDAAIAEGLKDLKFINNTDAPIYIEASADGSTLHFAIYGHETRDPNRTVRYESETTNTEDPTPSLTEDANASFGTIEQTSYGYQGSTARLWKIVNDNGNETKEQVNSSTYRMTSESIPWEQRRTMQRRVRKCRRRLRQMILQKQRKLQRNTARAVRHRVLRRRRKTAAMIRIRMVRKRRTTAAIQRKRRTMRTRRFLVTVRWEPVNCNIFREKWESRGKRSTDSVCFFV